MEGKKTKTSKRGVKRGSHTAHRGNHVTMGGGSGGPIRATYTGRAWTVGARPHIKPFSHGAILSAFFGLLQKKACGRSSLVIFFMHERRRNKKTRSRIAPREMGLRHLPEETTTLPDTNAADGHRLPGKDCPLSQQHKWLWGADIPLR